MPHRDYSHLGQTQSLCPECLAVVPAKIIAKGKRVYFRKKCPTHGERDDFVCSDRAYYDRLEYILPAKMPVEFGIEPDRGCPYDCGLCTEHEQHSCVGIVELTDGCNLSCPMCYASSLPGQKHRGFDDIVAAIDRLVEVEGRPEILQLSGGEPTIHPRFEELLAYALSRPIDFIMINTNGIRLAKDPRLVELIARHRDRVEIYFQMDGLRDDVHVALRGEKLLAVKLQAIEALGRHDIHTTLVSTVQPDVNVDQLGPLVKFGIERPWITGISFQPATYSGRHVLPADLERRVTFPDVIRGVCEQTEGMFVEDDFLPLPCAHPNCHSVSLAWRSEGMALPLTRFIDAKANFDLLANGLTFTRDKSKELIRQYLARQACCGPGGCGPSDCGPSDDGDKTIARESTNPPVVTLEGAGSPDPERFFEKVLAKAIGSEGLFRITITSFLDVYNFDLRRVMKCCTHHVLPDGHVIPFCAYNVLYRPGHVPLPKLTSSRAPLV